jgi:hypothetical protein
MSVPSSFPARASECPCFGLVPIRLRFYEIVLFLKSGVMAVALVRKKEFKSSCGHEQGAFAYSPACGWRVCAGGHRLSLERATAFLVLVAFHIE